jgi:hypothetical protein
LISTAANISVDRIEKGVLLGINRKRALRGVRAISGNNP